MPSQFAITKQAKSKTTKAKISTQKLRYFNTMETEEAKQTNHYERQQQKCQT